MKNIVIYYLLVLYVIGISSCVIPEEEMARTISFWTDMEMGNSHEISLLVNDEVIGAFRLSATDVVCGDSSLVDFVMYEQEDLVIAVMDSEEIEKILGEINLFSVSQGISITSREENVIFVQQDIDDLCTRVRLRW